MDEIEAVARAICAACDENPDHMQPTTEQIGILRHALGTGDDGRGRAYRNHYVTSAPADDHRHCMALTEQGLMQRHPPSALSGGDTVFTVTAAGREAAKPGPAPRDTRSRGKRRYDAYLHEDCGLSFGEWLKRGGYRSEERAHG